MNPLKPISRPWGDARPPLTRVPWAEFNCYEVNYQNLVKWQKLHNSPWIMRDTTIELAAESLSMNKVTLYLYPNMRNQGFPGFGQRLLTYYQDGRIQLFTGPWWFYWLSNDPRSRLRLIRSRLNAFLPAYMQADIQGVHQKWWIYTGRYSLPLVHEMIVGGESDALPGLSRDALHARWLGWEMSRKEAEERWQTDYNLRDWLDVEIAQCVQAELRYEIDLCDHPHRDGRELLEMFVPAEADGPEELASWSESALREILPDVTYIAHNHDYLFVRWWFLKKLNWINKELEKYD